MVIQPKEKPELPPVPKAEPDKKEASPTKVGKKAKEQPSEEKSEEKKDAGKGRGQR